MRIRDLHGWDVSPREAVEIQRRFGEDVVLEDRLALGELRLVAGVDNAYERRGAETTAHAAVVVMAFPSLEIVETRFASAPMTFPYVPGLLSFREAPAVLSALRTVESEPDAILFDAQGRAHPRRMGAASHLGLFVDRPSIGVAKSRLVGRYEEPGPNAGDRSPLMDRGEEIGAVVRTRAGKAPLFVSVGTMISLASAVEIVLACSRGTSRLPAPAQAAHDLVTRRAREAAAATLSSAAR